MYPEQVNALMIIMSYMVGAVLPIHPARVHPTPAPARGTCVACGSGFELTLPDDDDVPPGGGPFGLVATIARDVGEERRIPEVDIRLRHRHIGTLQVLAPFAVRNGPPVPMPEAPAHLDESTQLRQRDIRMPCHLLILTPEAPSVGKQPFAHDDLRKRIASLDRPHHLRPLLRHKLVHGLLTCREESDAQANYSTTITSPLGDRPSAS